MPAGWAALGAAAIGAAGSIASSEIQAGGQRRAAQTQADMFNTITGQENPYLTSGYGAQAELNALMGLGPPAYNPVISPGTQASTGFMTGPDGLMIPTPGGASPGTPPQYEFNGGAVGNTGLPTGFLTQTFNPTQQQLEQYPGYQFQLQQGDLALQSANSAGGSALSGPALKSLMGFNQGLAASNYNNYFNQFQTQQNNIFNRLSSIAQLGQNAAGNLGNAGTQLGTGIAQAQAGAAGSIAGGITGATNNIGQSILLSNLMGGQSDPYGPAGPSISLGGGGSVVSDPGFGGGS